MDTPRTVKLNVGGVLFETNGSTLAAVPGCLLADDEKLQEHWRPCEKHYFFDRDPVIFGAILNYLRTGQLHLPSNVCGPASQLELEYWQINPHKIERCCWTKYDEWNSILQALKQLERDQKQDKGSLPGGPKVPTRAASFWQRNRPKIWRMLTRSNSSLKAKIFGYVSLFFAVLSVFSFVAATTKYFQPDTVTLSQENISTTAIPDNSTTNSTTEAPSRSPVEPHPVLYVIDIVCLVYFTCEYSVRFTFAPRKLKYVTSLLPIFDVLALLPDFVEIFIGSIRPDVADEIAANNYGTMLRVLRVVRLFRLVRHSSGLWILLYTLRASIQELLLLIWFMMLGIIFFSSLIYFAEDRERFESIPSGFWWALITMTTVGYGDMYPVTTGGKFIGSACAVCGVLVIGFTVPALVNNFMLYYSQIKFAHQIARLQAMDEQAEGNDERPSTYPTLPTSIDEKVEMLPLSRRN